MEYIIKNEYLTATINSKGAELVSLVDDNNINRMHIPNIKTWNSVSPILFPQISRMKGSTYIAKGKEYEMPLHGFFRKSEITPLYIEKDKIEFVFEDNDETLKHYPYHFIFKVKYELIGKSLKVTLNTTNKDNDIMYYMVGGHPGFRVPLFDNEKYEDYYIEFEQKETVSSMQVVDGFLANEYKPYLNNQNIINLRHDLFIPDAIVLKGLKSNYVELKSKTNDKVLRFHFNDFEILAIWSISSNEGRHVCFEPWNGIQKNFVKEHEKMGVLKLNGHESSSFSYTIEIVK